MRKIVEIDSNGIVRTKTTLPNKENVSAFLPKFQFDVTSLKTEPEIGNVYLNGTFYNSDAPEAYEHLKNLIFDPLRKLQFNETHWARERHADCQELGIDDSVQWQKWLDYWQTLRDMPEQADFKPMNPIFPEQPK